MRTFAPNPKTTQQTTSAKPAVSGWAPLGQSIRGNPVLHLQRAVGNQTVLRWLEENSADAKRDRSSATDIARFSQDFSGIVASERMPMTSGRIQTKLMISTPRDIDEEEADRVADEVVSMPASASIQRMGRECDEEESCLQPKLHEDAPALPNREPRRTKPSAANRLDHEFVAPPGFPAQLDSSKGGGHALPESINGFMSHVLGVDFSDVRIHTGDSAIYLNRSIGARAFTSGKDIYFNRGEYQPESSKGKHLLAHELAHVVQQTGADGMRVGQNDEKGRSPVSARLAVPSASVIQRACGEADIRDAVRGHFTSIELGDPGVTGTLVRFRVACDEFLSSADETTLRGLASSLSARTRIIIHGFASEEGPPMFNLLLSQARAVKAKDVLSSALDPAQIERVVMHGAIPGARSDWRSVIIETKGPLPLVTKTLNIVSWISGRGLPDFSRARLALDPPSIRVLDAACMALKCTANPAPPATLPPSAVSAFLASKQYRAFQTYTITHIPSTSARGTFVPAQVVGFTAPSSCPDVPPTTFQMGEVSPLNHATPNMSGTDPQAEALMKFRVSAAEESAAIREATSFPGSLLFSTSMLRHVPWVWTQTSLRLEAGTGLLNWSVQGSAFPTHTIYLDGARVAEIPQSPCGVVVASRFRTAAMPRQTMAEEARQVSVPISAQDETVDPGGTASGAG